MSTTQKKSINWSKWGFWLAVLALIVTIVTWYISTKYERSPELSIEIVSNEELLTIKEELPDLNVTYRDINLRENQQNISIVTLRLINDGNESILLNHYDKDHPLGILIENGTILNMPFLTKSSDSTYYKSVVESINNDSIVFKNRIIDPQSFFTLKMLILNKISVKPKFKAFGKIAKIPSIKITESPVFKVKERTIWDSIFPILAGVFIALFANFASALIIRFRNNSNEDILKKQLAELQKKVAEKK